MNIKVYLKKIGNTIRNFFSDEYGGNLVEYALLIGFALFIFFIITGIITSILDWTVGLSDDFLNIFG
jgi:Flp pilus assembly pilin Flp